MKHRKALKAQNSFQAILTGLVAGVSVTVFCILLIAAVLVKYDIQTDMIKYLLFIPSVLGGSVSGFVTGKFVRSKGFLWGFVAAFAVSVIFTLALLLINSFSVGIIILLFIPAYSVFGSIGGIAAANLR